MKPKLRLYDLLILLPAGLPFAYLAWRYPQMPVTVPAHFNIDGHVDKWGPKSGLWGMLAITSGISVLLYVLVRFLPKLGFRKDPRNSAGLYTKIIVAVVMFLGIINCLIVNAAEKGSFDIGGAFPVVLGFFFALIGNLMYNIKPNYFIGVRTPWTLKNETTWRKTHQLAGKIWFAGGILMAVTSLFLPSRMVIYLLIAGLFILALIPVVYSYTFYKSLDKSTHH